MLVILSIINSELSVISKTATYLDYYNWIDPMLANLKRHPIFRYQFLMYAYLSTSAPEDPSASVTVGSGMRTFIRRRRNFKIKSKTLLPKRVWIV